MNNFKKLPEELLYVLFSYLDKETKLIVTNVCEKWRAIIHYNCWKRISKLIEEGDDTMMSDFRALGWNEEEHEFGTCKCIDLDLGNYPFKNAAWTASSYNNYINIEFDVDSEGLVLDKSKGICACTSFEVEGFADEWDDERKWITNVTLYELDLTEVLPSWKKLQNIRYEEDDMLRGLDREEAEIVLKSRDNTLFLQELYWEVPEIRITMWNIEPWEFVFELPFTETLNDVFKSISGVSGRQLSLKYAWNFHLEVSSDMLVVCVNINERNFSNVRALMLFWNFDASNPATSSFLTYIQEDKNHLSGLHLNNKYFCKRKKENLEVFAVEDIRNNATSKSWLVPAFGNSGPQGDCGDDDGLLDCGDDDGLLEGGSCNRFAVFWRSENVHELNIFNICSGDRLFNLKLNTLDLLVTPGFRRIRRFEPVMKFQLGKLIFFQPIMRRCNFEKNGYQIVIVDEKSLKNQVVTGAYLEVNEWDVEGPIFMSSKSIIRNCEDYTFHWKLEH